MTDSIECGGCKKSFPAEEVKYIEIKGCCSSIRVPLCRKCMEKHNKKMKEVGVGLS